MPAGLEPKREFVISRSAVQFRAPAPSGLSYGTRRRHKAGLVHAVFHTCFRPAVPGATRIRSHQAGRAGASSGAHLRRRRGTATWRDVFRVTAQPETRRIVLIDFEASSLEPGGFPIEVGWVSHSGEGECRLIRPSPDWQEWSATSEAVHGISRGMLHEHGLPHALVAAELGRCLAPETATVFADSPAFDGEWLHMLLRSGGIRDRIPVRDVIELYAAACRPLFTSFGRTKAAAMAQRIVTETRDAEESSPRPRHRALADAEGMWWIWREIERRVKAATSTSDHRTDEATP